MTVQFEAAPVARPRNFPPQVTPSSLARLEPLDFLSSEKTMRQAARGGLIQFTRNTLDRAEGPIQTETLAELIREVAEIDSEHPIFSVQPFRYIVAPELPEIGTVLSAEDSTAAALNNMRYMTETFGADTFAVGAMGKKRRAVQWVAPLDDIYDIRVRGGAGAGAFSIDFGLGLANPDHAYKHKELWRAGIDTFEWQDGFAARFTRTGTGVKLDDEPKVKAFEQFRKTYGILPQRLLGLIGLYFMRELEPDHALAMTTQGAKRFSTLNWSNGSCDYTGIFANIGFEPTTSPYWSLISEFSEGFYRALESSRIRRREADLLNIAFEAINNMTAVDSAGEPLEDTFPIKLCSDQSVPTIEKELLAHELSELQRG